MLNSQQTSTVKLCLLVLAEWADADGTNCYPSIPSIAEKATVNEKTVRRSLDQAAEAGFIRRSHVGTKQGWRRFVYLPTIPQGADTKPARLIERADTESTPPTETCGLSVQNVRTLSPEGVGTESTDLSTTYLLPSKQQRAADAGAVRFEEFWSIYPKHVGKKPARQRWQTRKLDRIADQIIADVRNRTANDDAWKRGFAPNPLTYINQDRWEDGACQPVQVRGTAVEPRRIATPEQTRAERDAGKAKNPVPVEVSAQRAATALALIAGRDVPDAQERLKQQAG